MMLDRYKKFTILARVRYHKLTKGVQYHPAAKHTKRLWTSLSLSSRAIVLLATVSTVVVLGWVYDQHGASAQTLTFNKDDYFAGTSRYGEIQIGDKGTSIQLQRGVVGVWSGATSTNLQLPPSLSYGIANLVYGPNNTLYSLTSLAGQCHFERYSIEIQRWDALNTPPVSCGTGTVMVFDGSSSFYYLPGGSSSSPLKRLFRYDIITDTWTELQIFPSLISNISDGVFVSRGSEKYVYLFPGLGSSALWRYSINEDAWSSMSAFPDSLGVGNGLAVEWDGATTLYAISNGTGEFKKYDIVTNIWSPLTRYVDNGVAGRYDLELGGNNKIYATKLEWSSERVGFRSYDLTTGTWTTLPPQPAVGNYYDFPLPITYDGTRYMYTYAAATTHVMLYRYDTISSTWNGSTLLRGDLTNADVHYKTIYDGGQSVYYFGGRAAFNRLFKYDLGNGQPIQISSQQSITQSGYTGVYNGGALYVMPLDGGRKFRRYDIATNVFSDLADLPLAAYVAGMDIVDGGDNYLYTIFGGNQTGFYRYNIASNSWGALTSMPTGSGGGGSIARVGRKIYVLSGNQTSNLYVYDIDTAKWSSLVGIPSGGIDHGAFMASDQARYLYLGINGRIDATARKVYRYDTTNSIWERIADLPAPSLPYASSFYDTANNKLYVSQGADSSLIWDWSPNSANFVTSGTWLSKTYDLEQVESWTSLNTTISGSGSVVIETRSSADGRIWSTWQPVVGTSVMSPTNRYLQIKFILSGDGLTTPIVRDISIQYARETSPPTLPSQMTASSKEGGVQLISGQTYEYQHPYFSWSGSSDGSNGAGVDGYYVYFGSESNADPIVSGNFQRDQMYTVTTPMTAGEVYYLRIKVKDKLGNISAAATYFSYRYFYISPPGSIVKTSSADFTEGVNTDVMVDNGSMQLRRKDSGVWSTGPSAMLPDNASGSSLAIVGDYIYMARGGGTTDFWRYNLVSRSWDTMAAAPGAIGSGSSMVSDKNGTLYLVAGNSTYNFYSYKIENNSWEALPNMPVSATIGTSVVYIGDGKFLILFTSSRALYLYDSSDKTYSFKQVYPTTIESGGTGMWYDGNDTVYAYFGYLSWGNFSGSARDTMAKYSISNDSWKSLAPPPVVASNNQNNLVSDGRGGLYVFTHNTYDNLDKRQRALRYDIANNSWAEVSGVESQIYSGSVVSDGNRYIYAVPSGNSTNSRRFMRYDTWTGTFSPDLKSIDVLDRIPYTAGSNAWQWIGGNSTTAAYDGSKYIYAIGGSESASSWTRFVKFDHVSGETIYLPQPPIIGVGGSLAHVNNELFYLPGKSTRDFYKFDEASARWLRMNDAPSNVYRPGPSSLVTVGNVLYAAIGNGRMYYKYTPDAAGGLWTRMTDAPGIILNGSSVYDETDNAVYVLAANGTTAFYKFNVATNTWSSAASLPAISTYGSAMTVNNGKIYVQIGNMLKNSYVYDISTNSWSDAGLAPEIFRYGSRFIKVSSTYALAFSGEASPDVWKFIYPSDTTAYDGQAIHITQPLVAAGIYDYAGVALEADIPSKTSVEVWTRSSDDGLIWDEWKITDNIKYYSSGLSARINSSSKGHTQIKLVMSSEDNVSTPTIYSVALQYYFDVDPPTNPITVNVYADNTRVNKIDNNKWYNHEKPLIDWPEPGEPGGATDGPLGSNIAGYWVYFGTDNTASPRTAGTFVTETEYEASLTLPGNYYVRIQAQDMTGNIDGAVLAPYVYKFDNQPPTNPSLVTVTPSGFTSRNNFTFEWPNAYDANSGIAGYCYHTGATSGPFAVEICQAGKILQNVSAAYRSGTNVFYVRAYDTAGNYSQNYASASFYYSTDPPGPVMNLRAVPPTSVQNMFAFAWELPTLFSGDPDLLTYCYSINILPSSLNTICTADMFVSAFKAATQQGTNVIYVVAKDEAGNVNWNDYASANFIANTVSPGIPLGLVVTDTSDRISNRWSLTSTWDAPTFVGSGIKSYIIERSEDGHTFVEIGNTSTRAFVDLDISPEITYYYRVRAADNVDNRGGASAIVARSARGSFAAPPQIVVQPDAKVGFDQAKISWATSREATSFVYYGTAPNDLGQSKGSLSLLTDHSQIITGLRPSTTYYYRVQSFDNERSYQLNDAYSPIYSFRTTEAARVYDVAISDLTTNSALVSWKSSVPTKVRVEYGTTLGYGFVLDNESTGYSTTHSMKLVGLPSGALHHMRILSVTDFGSQLSSDDYTFQTIARPVVSTIRFQPLNDEASAAVLVSWITNVPTSSTVRYSALGDKLESTLSELTTEHEVVLRNLASDTDYSITVEGRDQYGNLVSSAIQNWRSQLDTRPPTATDISLSVTVTETAKGKRAQLIAVWKTDEPSTSQITYGRIGEKALNNKTPLNTEPTVNHVVIISDLNLADIYKVQLISRDLNGNTVYTPNTTIVTPDKEMDVFDNILNLMLRIFRL